MVSQLQPWLKNFGIEISRNQLQLLKAYLDLLLLWNEKINLIGTTQPDRIVEELIFDSLLPAKYLPTEGSVLDIGSGGGIPAIPLKILIPTLEFLLLEPRRKKASFLKETIRRLKMERIELLRIPIEGLPQGFKADGFDVIIARAVMKPEKIVEIAIPHLADHGRVVLFLGQIGNRKDKGRKRNLNYLKTLGRSKGYKEEKLVCYQLPRKKTERAILILKREG